MQRPARAGVYSPNPKFQHMNIQLKSASLILALAVVALPALRAEDSPSDKSERKRERDPGAMMERATKELGLTADQEAKWKAINQQEKAALKALREDTAVAKEDKRAKAREINQGFAAQRRAILTADQAVKLDEKRDEMRDKRRDRMEERREHGPKGEKKGDK